MSFAGPRRGSGQHIDTVKKFLVSFGFCFAIGLAAWGAFRVDVPNTEPFRVAEKFLVSNSKVVAAVGPVESIRLPVFNEWEISYVGESDGAAFFHGYSGLQRTFARRRFAGAQGRNMDGHERNNWHW